MDLEKPCLRFDTREVDAGGAKWKIPPQR